MNNLVLVNSGLPKVFGRSQRFLTFGFAFGCQRSMQPKAEGLAEGWNFWNSVNLSANFVTKILEWSKCMFFQCSKRFEILYYIISIRAFQSLCLNMPIEYLNTKYQTFGFTFGFDFEGRSFSTFAFGFGYGQKITFDRPLLKGFQYLPNFKGLWLLLSVKFNHLQYPSSGKYFSAI